MKKSYTLALATLCSYTSQQVEQQVEQLIQTEQIETKSESKDMTKTSVTARISANAIGSKCAKTHKIKPRAGLTVKHKQTINGDIEAGFLSTISSEHTFGTSESSKCNWVLPTATYNLSAYVSNPYVKLALLKTPNSPLIQSANPAFGDINTGICFTTPYSCNVSITPNQDYSANITITQEGLLLSTVTNALDQAKIYAGALLDGKNFFFLSFKTTLNDVTLASGVKFDRTSLDAIWIKFTAIASPDENSPKVKAQVILGHQYGFLEKTFSELLISTKLPVEGYGKLKLEGGFGLIRVGCKYNGYLKVGVTYKVPIFNSEQA